MHRWRKVAAYMTDREKELMAESFFTESVCMVKFHAGAAQVNLWIL